MATNGKDREYICSRCRKEVDSQDSRCCGGLIFTRFLREVTPEKKVRPERRHAIERSRELLSDRSFFLDTETTGLGDDAEICEIAVVSFDGSVVVNSRVRPLRSISTKATKIHGITDADVAHAPTIGEVLTDEIRQQLSSGPLCIYNRDFDLGVLKQTAFSAQRGDIEDWTEEVRPRSECVMVLYSEYYGLPAFMRPGYRWQKLSIAARQCGLEWEGKPHGALADTRMSFAILKHMAETEVEVGNVRPQIGNL